MGHPCCETVAASYLELFAHTMWVPASAKPRLLHSMGLWGLDTLIVVVERLQRYWSYLSFREYGLRKVDEDEGHIRQVEGPTKHGTPGLINDIQTDGARSRNTRTTLFSTQYVISFQ